MNLINIVKAYIIFILIKSKIINDEEIIDTALYRLNVCNSCTKKKHGFCKICKCFLKAKVVSKTQKCPLKKW